MKIFNRSIDIKKTLGLLVVLLTVVLFGRTLVNNWNEVRDIGLRGDIYSVLAVGLFTIAVLLGGILWGKVLSALDKDETEKIRTIEFIKVHVASWLLKYIPGQVSSFLGKVAWGTSIGISKKTVSISFLYENIFLALASILLSLPVLFITSQATFLGNLSSFIPLIILLPFLIIFNKNLFYKLINFSLSSIKKDKISNNYFLNIQQILGFLFIYTLPRIVNGIAFILIAISLFDISSSNYLLFASTYIFAGIIGLLAIFVPSGIGVREAIIVIFLGGILGTTPAIVLSIYTRFFATIADVFLAIIYLTINKFLNFNLQK